MEELQRLKNLLQIIDWAKGNEEEFEKIYQLMQEEYPEKDIKTDTYFKEARVYIGERANKRANKKELSIWYEEFLDNFKSMINNRLYRLK